MIELYDDNQEIWKDIPGYEGKYQVSNLGRIKSLKRKVLGKNPYTGKPFMRTVNERILRPARFCKCGHLSIPLGKGVCGKPIHRLVMEAFVGKAPPGMEVLHRNGIPTDNRLTNLRYGTRTENILDVYYQGKRWRKLSIEDVEEIRFGLYCGICGRELARMYNVAESAISSIKRGRSFQWL